MTSTDKDFRFMATNDLMTELQKDSIKLDDDSERKVGVMLTAGVYWMASYYWFKARQSKIWNPESKIEIQNLDSKLSS